MYPLPEHDNNKLSNELTSDNFGLSQEMKILVVEDDVKLVHVLQRDLSEMGFQVEIAMSGDDGLRAALDYSFDLLVVDGMLPKMDGWTLIKHLRKHKATPVLMLTARDAVDDRVAGLEVGADDYLTKPFHFDELVARIKALGRRAAGSYDNVLTNGELTLDPNSQTVTYSGEIVSLTAREYLILQKLLSRLGRIFPGEEIATYLSSMDEEVAINTVEVHISRLRKKISKTMIRTVRGLGYTIDRA